MSDDFDSDDLDGGGIPFLRKLGVPEGMDALVLTIAFVALIGAGYAAYWFGVRVRVARGGLPDEAYVVNAWEADAPIPVDVNGDGQEDFVGAFDGDGGIFLGAFDGKKGLTLWRYGPIDIERPVVGGLPQFGLQGNLLLVNQKTKGSVVELATGKPLGEIALPNARTLCAGETPSAPLLVQTTSADQPFLVDVAARSTKPLSGRLPCTRTMARARSVDATPYAANVKLLWAIRDGASIVGMGLDSSRAPTLHGFAEGKTEPRFSVPVASEGADALVPQNGWDLAGGKLFLAYRLKSKPNQHQVLALDAVSGKQLWRIPLDSRAIFVKSLSASETRVYVVIGEYLVVLDASSGAMLLDKGTGRE